MVDRKNIGGVGFLVNSTVHHLVDSYKIISPRVAILRMGTKDQGTISIINGYAPTSAATDEQKEEFYKLFERTVNVEKSYYKVVVGDFNATVVVPLVIKLFQQTPAASPFVPVACQSAPMDPPRSRDKKSVITFL
ncbi:unnamed protein product [Heligmosomoides polygyrus]|uniref:Craniofacial development protein 2-like n=1 Tax=Heligmosomoides polygyrus TaxID=6339 RepID=A0A183GMR2_HELPZ|nr:unnamed protein product [Heligmosomoides polygyrus]